MKKTNRLNKSFKSLIPAALALSLTITATALPADKPAQQADETKPVVRTYEKEPDPDGDDRKLDATRYQAESDETGQKQDEDYVRYQENPDLKDRHAPRPLKVLDTEESE